MNSICSPGTPEIRRTGGSFIEKALEARIEKSCQRAFLSRGAGIEMLAAAFSDRLAAESVIQALDFYNMRELVLQSFIPVCA